MSLRIARHILDSTTPNIKIVLESYTWALADGSVVGHHLPPTPPKTKQPRVSLVISHANGINKETYRPVVSLVFDKLAALPATQRNNVGSILAIDVRNQGDSLQVNKSLNGGKSPFPDVLEWRDAALDLQYIVKTVLAGDIVLGIGHSLGGGLSCMAQILSQDSLFSRLVLFEPILYSAKTVGLPFTHDQMGADTMRRKNGWTDKAAWEAYVNTKKFYTSWQTDALRAYLDAGVVGLDKQGNVVWSTGPATAGSVGPVTSSASVDRVVLKTDPREEASIFRGSMSCTSAYFARLDEISIPAVVISGAQSDIGTQQMPSRKGHVVFKDLAIAEGMQNAVWKKLPGEHMLVQQKPEDPGGFSSEYPGEK